MAASPNCWHGGAAREPAHADVGLISMRARRWHERCPRIKKGLRHVPLGSSPSGYISRTTGGRHELRAILRPTSQTHNGVAFGVVNPVHDALRSDIFPD